MIIWTWNFFGLSFIKCFSGRDELGGLKRCVTCDQESVLVNGSAGSEFKMERRLRHS